MPLTQNEKPTRLPRTVKEMSKDQLKETLLKKKECDAVALKTVERMIENPVNKEWFLNNLKNIRQNHFSDVVEERAILKQCGYPLCLEKLTNVLRQQYHISVKTNKVYDTTERKMFCSNQCYKASNYLQEQLLSSPLWFPEEVPVYKLLPVGSVGIVGTEINMGDKDSSIKSLDGTNLGFTLTSEFAVESLSKFPVRQSVEGESVKEDKLTSALRSTASFELKEQEIKSTYPAGRKSETTGDSLFVVERREERIVGMSKVDNLILKDKSFQGGLLSKAECTEAPNQQDNAHPSTTRAVRQLKSKPNPVARSTASRIETNLREWCNLETLVFLFGEAKVKCDIVSSGRSVKEYNEVFSSLSCDPRLQDRYDRICKRLNLMDVDDSRFDETLRSVEKHLRPLPSYRDVQEDAKTMELKVGAFYRGKVAYVADTTEAEEGGAADEAPENVMPLVDINSQKTLRRNIVLDRLKRASADLLRICGLSSSEVHSEVRPLVHTFSLEAHNITYKPLEWILLSIVILKMLALKNLHLQSCLESVPAKKHWMSVLQSLHLKEVDITNLVNKLTCIDHLIPSLPKEMNAETQCDS